MTDQLRQAAQAVIKAWDNDGSTQTMEDLRAALEQQAEPVAWMSSDRAWMWSDYSKAIAAVANIPTLTLIPLYTAPPQRPWVSLTDEYLAQIDTEEIYGVVGNHMAIAMAVEAVLKEKNG